MLSRFANRRCLSVGVQSLGGADVSSYPTDIFHKGPQFTNQEHPDIAVNHEYIKNSNVKSGNIKDFSAWYDAQYAEIEKRGWGKTTLGYKITDDGMRSAFFPVQDYMKDDPTYFTQDGLHARHLTTTSGFQQALDNNFNTVNVNSTGSNCFPGVPVTQMSCMVYAIVAGITVIFADLVYDDMRSAAKEGRNAWV